LSVDKRGMYGDLNPDEQVYPALQRFVIQKSANLKYPLEPAMLPGYITAPKNAWQ